MKCFFLLMLCFVTVVSSACKGKTEAIALKQGKALYQNHCASCHGAEGKGDGPLALHLSPKPRDLTKGVFKYRTTHGPIPSDIDILQTLKVGIPGTSMPGWDMLAMEDWQALLAYIKTLSPRLQGEVGVRIDVPEEPKASPERIQAGRGLYVKGGCENCHGVSGTGDGLASIHLKDVWGGEVTPRDLTRGPLKWGNHNPDIYRTLLVGIPGTPMPGFERTFTKEELWSLVHYLKSIQKMPKDYDPSDPKRNLIQLVKVDGEIPGDPMASAWQKQKGVPVFLKPMQAKKGMTEWVVVKGLYNKDEVAYLVSWEDGDDDTEGENLDRLTLQFPRTPVPMNDPKALPFLGMGHAGHPVVLWQWQPTGIRVFEAEGVQQIREQTPPSNRSVANGVYADGRWQVLFRFPVAQAPAQGYLSFGLWDGDLFTHRGPHLFSEWMMYQRGE